MRLLFAVLLAFLAALSQDTRKIAEPVIPPHCTFLRAMLNRVGSSIYAGDEDKPDTDWPKASPYRFSAVVSASAGNCCRDADASTP